MQWLHVGEGVATDSSKEVSVVGAAVVVGVELTASELKVGKSIQLNNAPIQSNPSNTSVPIEKNTNK